MTDLQQQKQDAIALLNELNNLDTYELISDENGIKVEKANVGPSGTYRMHGIMNVNAQKVFEGLTNIENTTKLSTSIVKYELVEQKDDIKVIYHEHKSPAFTVSARDFVVLTAARKEDDGSYLIVSSSITHDKQPERSGFVRGHLHVSGYYLKPVGDNKCDLTYIIQTGKTLQYD
jgi:hypothetical protein